ncbi:hypothetical protein F511_09278 [Dorcoceras hygrometricum]|uniref:Uncharacterized protein n=1 Tax=Dorcoceras hygrometricum TaxID=472368 RepID=A0A2Z7C8S0_9LAMI|nr:hypothetical protein F511_09278 [Dorcoceras hygrometricum]
MGRSSQNKQIRSDQQREANQLRAYESCSKVEPIRSDQLRAPKLEQYITDLNRADQLRVYKNRAALSDQLIS